jgi:hypothetical protein
MCLGQLHSFRLDRFATYQHMYIVFMQPILELENLLSLACWQ